MSIRLHGTTSHKTVTFSIKIDLTDIGPKSVDWIYWLRTGTNAGLL
jgi:hypothetical protein